MWKLPILFAVGAMALASVASAQIPAPIDAPTVYHSSGSKSWFKSIAGVDTFCLYGGPGSLRGKFQNSINAPLTAAELLNEATTLAGEANGWIFDDVTDQPVCWQRSTFEMENLNSNGPGNFGMWAGRTSAQEPGWGSAPGYGNNWNCLLEWRTNSINPATSQSVSIDFYYNLDSEAGFDFFEVEYDSAGSTIIAQSVSGSSKSLLGNFDPPGTFASLNLPYQANGYANGNSEIVIRLAARSDGGYSDEDGILDTDGLAEVDDITVGWTDGGGSPVTDTENFEGPGPYSWDPVQSPFAGYFGKVFGLVQDLDPCADNTSPLYAFIDDGTPPSNATYVGTGTGGTTSLNWSYGVPGNWVVNYNGGVSGGLFGVQNRLLTPPVAWDLPGTADDGPQVAGARLKFDVWPHLPLQNGILYTWEVRGRENISNNWSPWANRGFVYYGDPTWRSVEIDVSDLIAVPNGLDGVQVRLQCADLSSVFAFPGTDATVAPMFDNVTFQKYVIGGPVISVREVDMFQDSFSQSGLTDCSTQAARDQLDVRVDMAQDINFSGPANVPGDSMVVMVTSAIPGSSIATADITLHWELLVNATFEDPIRGNLTGHPNAILTGANPNRWHGSEGAVETGVPGLYAFDLPDSDFFYPGDHLRWYIQATDDGGGSGGIPLTTTFPADLSTWAIPKQASKVGDDCLSFVFAAPFRLYPTKVLAKPSIWLSFAGKNEPTLQKGFQHVPSILVVDDSGNSDMLARWSTLADQLGLRDPVEYETYKVLAADSGVSNGIGSEGAHGADAPQLSVYSCIVYLSDNNPNFLLSNGTNTGVNDKGDDIGNLTDWHNQAADRSMVYFGDDIAVGVNNNSATYLNTIMGVGLNGDDVSPSLNGILSPLVVPTASGGAAGFVADFVAYGGCPDIRDFDDIGPFAPSANNFVSHEFLGPMGTNANAGVVFDRLSGGFRKVNVTFPFSLLAIQNGGSTGAGGGISDRSVLMNEVLNLFGGHGPGGPPVDTPAVVSELAISKMYPNPFNPRTTLSLEVPYADRVNVRVFDLRGRLVRELHDGVMQPGTQQVTWHGDDQDGRTVATGVYLVQVTGFGKQEAQKVMMVK